jgi:hypothetical protein
MIKKLYLRSNRDRAEAQLKKTVKKKKLEMSIISIMPVILDNREIEKIYFNKKIKEFIPPVKKINADQMIESANSEKMNAIYSTDSKSMARAAYKKSAFLANK